MFARKHSFSILEGKVKSQDTIRHTKVFGQGKREIRMDKTTSKTIAAVIMVVVWWGPALYYISSFPFLSMVLGFFGFVSLMAILFSSQNESTYRPTEEEKAMADSARSAAHNNAQIYQAARHEAGKQAQREGKSYQEGARGYEQDYNDRR